MKICYIRTICSLAVTPPGFCNRGEVRYGSIGGLEYEVPQSRLYWLCINVALCSTAVQCICRVIRRSSMTMKAHRHYIIFGRPLIGGKLPLLPPDVPLQFGFKNILAVHLPTIAYHFFSWTDSTDSPDCLSILLSISVFFSLLFLFSTVSCFRL